MGKKLARIREINREATRAIKETAKQKIKNAAHNRRVIALIMVELILIIIIAVAIYVYLDPETNIVPFPWNLVGFILVLLLALFLYSYTIWFRNPESAQT